jgi:hypothetical protein
VFRYEAGMPSTSSSVVKPNLSGSGSPMVMSFMVVLSRGWVTIVPIYSYNGAVVL